MVNLVDLVVCHVPIFIGRLGVVMFYVVNPCATGTCEGSNNNSLSPWQNQQISIAATPTLLIWD